MPRQAAASAGFATNGSTRQMIQPPADLNEFERAEFVSVVLGSPPNHFLPADIATISAYARAVIAEKIAAGELAVAPVIDGKPSAWLPVWLGQLRACTTLARRLNINPAGRVPMKPSEPDAPVSYYTRQRLLEVATMTTRLTDADPLTDVDRDAMTRAIEMCRSENKGRRQQIDQKLKDEKWRRVGRFAAYSCQIDALHLEPWEWPPIWIRDIDAALLTPNDARRIGDAARLLQKMLALGISRYEPDPLAAIAAAEQPSSET